MSACGSGDGGFYSAPDTGGGEQNNGGGDDNTGGGGDDTGGGGDDTGGGGGNPSDGDARACYDTNQGVIGTRVESVYRSTDSQSGLVLTTTSDTLVNRQTTFNGQTVIEAVSEVQADASDDTFDSQSTTTSYYTTDDASFSFKVYGGTTEVSTPFAMTTTLTNEPFILNSLDLDVGESYSQQYTQQLESNVSPFPLPETQVSSTRTYEGRESVTVPAGTFDACKIREETTTTVNGSSTNGVSTSWIDVESGLQVKGVAGNTTSELLSAEINGQSIQ